MFTTITNDSMRSKIETRRNLSFLSFIERGKTQKLTYSAVQINKKIVSEPGINELIPATNALSPAATPSFKIIKYGKTPQHFYPIQPIQPSVIHLAVILDNNDIYYWKHKTVNKHQKNFTGKGYNKQSRG